LEVGGDVKKNLGTSPKLTGEPRAQATGVWDQAPVAHAPGSP
jgi:hypothetical protein